MKQLILLLCAATGTCAWAREVPSAVTDSLQDDLHFAIHVLIGQDSTQTKEWALQWLEETQDIDGDASMQNLLGMAYLRGWGTESDTMLAVYLLEQAVVGGNALTRIILDSSECISNIEK